MRITHTHTHMHVFALRAAFSEISPNFLLPLSLRALTSTAIYRAVKVPLRENTCAGYPCFFMLFALRNYIDAVCNGSHWLAGAFRRETGKAGNDHFANGKKRLLSPRYARLFYQCTFTRPHRKIEKHRRINPADTKDWQNRGGDVTYARDNRPLKQKRFNFRLALILQRRELRARVGFIK